MPQLVNKIRLINSLLYTAPYKQITPLIPLIPLVLAHLFRLAAIRPPRLHLVPSHARAQLDIHSRRRREAKALCNLDQVQLLHVVDGPQAVAGVGVEVGLEGILGALLQVVVLSDELLELGLDVDNLLSRELELDDGDTSGLEVGQEADFVGLVNMLVTKEVEQLCRWR